jgi:hypothetical protein
MFRANEGSEKEISCMGGHCLRLLGLIVSEGRWALFVDALWIVAIALFPCAANGIHNVYPGVTSTAALYSVLWVRLSIAGEDSRQEFCEQ